MKKYIFALVFILTIQNSYAQEDTITSKVVKEFEKYCPIYILDYYCSKTGLSDIIKAANLDERVGGINNRDANDPKDPKIAIKYYNNVIVFDKYKTEEHLGNFIIFFNNKIDMDNFTRCYKYLMAFVEDQENENRFYHKDGPMNAVIKNSIPEKQRYTATCFVAQFDYCGKY